MGRFSIIRCNWFTSWWFDRRLIFDSFVFLLGWIISPRKMAIDGKQCLRSTFLWSPAAHWIDFVVCHCLGLDTICDRMNIGKDNRADESLLTVLHSLFAKSTLTMLDMATNWQRKAVPSKSWLTFIDSSLSWFCLLSFSSSHFRTCFCFFFSCLVWLCRHPRAIGSWLCLLAAVFVSRRCQVVFVLCTWIAVIDGRRAFEPPCVGGVRIIEPIFSIIRYWYFSHWAEFQQLD